MDEMDLLRSHVIPLSDTPGAYDRLLDMIGSAHIVLLGEASHGTREFYRARADITLRLCVEKGFSAVAVEADWPYAYRVNKYVRHWGEDENAIAALDDFRTFPHWMWRNTEVVEFINRLRNLNFGKPDQEMIGFYGLDLYSMYSSIDAVLTYLDKVDPEAAQRARQRYSCFEHYAPEEESYGMAMTYVRENCRRQAIAQLKEMRARTHSGVASRGFVANEERFFAEQNARLTRDAEAYYRHLFDGRVSTWNLRDRHMAEVLYGLMQHIAAVREPRVVVWAHNSHVGNALATSVSSQGELNIGQLVKQRSGGDSCTIGFFTHEGTVSAASSWGGEVEAKKVRPSLQNSFERLFHNTGIIRFLIDTRAPVMRKTLGQRTERAIGVIYLPESERSSHYFLATLSDQFDAGIHIDTTHAIEPLEKNPLWTIVEPIPETFASGL